MVGRHGPVQLGVARAVGGLLVGEEVDPAVAAGLVVGDPPLARSPATRRRQGAMAVTCSWYSAAVRPFRRKVTIRTYMGDPFRVRVKRIGGQETVRSGAAGSHRPFAPFGCGRGAGGTPRPACRANGETEKAGIVSEMESERVTDRLAVAAATALVGRERERDQLRSWVMDPDGPSAVFVHGAAGIGKTALGDRHARRSHDGGRRRSGGRTHTGHRAGPPRVPSWGWAPPHPRWSRWQGVAGASVVALVIDSYERFGLVDGWLRNRLLPSLPARTTAVLVGRNPPNVAWRTAPGWRQLSSPTCSSAPSPSPAPPNSSPAKASPVTGRSSAPPELRVVVTRSR